MAILVAGFHPIAHAAEIYRWVDDDGVVHYSDTKPGEPHATLQIDDTRPSDYDPNDDFYSIVNQARRLNETLIELAAVRQQREEQKRAEAENNAYDVKSPYAPYEPYVYAQYPLYYSSPTPFYRSAPRWRAQQQLRAIEELALSQPPAYSINSGGHRTRVESSKRLPATVLQSPAPR